MIRRVSVINHLGDKLDLDLYNPEKAGLAITNIEGLGPPKASIAMTPMASMDGSTYDMARTESRNVILNLAFLWSPTIEAARLRTYRYFPIKRKITFEVQTDSRFATADCYVESNEPNIFSDKEGSVINLMFPDSYLYSAGSSGNFQASFNFVMPKFEFPFSNESLVDPLLEFGSIERRKVHPITYTGDVDTGLVISMTASGPVVNPSFYNVTTRERIGVNTTALQRTVPGGFLAGDRIVISTIRGAKGAYLKRAGQFYNVLHALGRDISWLRMQAGVNEFAFAADGGEEFLHVDVDYRLIYEGV